MAIKLPYRGIFISAWHLLRETFLEFLDNNSFDRGAALAYYTIFALPPIIIIMINSVGALFGKEAVSGEIYYEIKGLIGSEGAYEVQKMVENVSRSGELTITTVIGIFTFLVAATGLFISMQDALNVIWGVKPKPRNQYFKILLDRVLSFAMILSFNFILLVSLVVQAVIAKLGNYLMELLDQTAVVLLQMVNELLSLGVVAFIFAMIFKFLPDAKIRWREVWVGAIVTSLLFALGRFIIGFYLGNSNYASIYGAAGTVVIILVWVFYSSQILFFGAVFTLVFSRKYGSNIYPSQYAVRVIRQELEVGKTAVNAEPGKFEQPES
jgi:membrane protein